MASMTRDLPPRLVAWLDAHLDEPGPFSWRRLAGGQSNHTYLLEGAAATMILRRPPDATIDPSAHSMEREHLMLQALGRSDAPAPRPLAFCTDLDVIGVPFLVMEHVAGDAVRDVLPPAAPPQPQAAREIGEALIDALATLQSVPWREVGLEGFGRPDGFLERQVGRWTKQFRRVQVRELPRFDAVGAWLEAHRPPATAPAIVHGDFHSDNSLTVFDGPARVAAILDWEMATIGDPLLDVGLLLAYWGSDGRPADLSFPEMQAFSRVPGAPAREELAERYAAATGRTVEHLDYYMVLSFWKLAAIVEGAYANHLAGSDDTAHARRMETQVPFLLEEAATVAGLA
jgi:aminoglycoside phosphotransferase (APT) family kinase protein